MAFFCWHEGESVMYNPMMQPNPLTGTLGFWSGFRQGSLNDLFGEDQTMQRNDKFDGFPLHSAFFRLVI